MQSQLSSRRVRQVVSEPRFELSVLSLEDVEGGSLFPSVCLNICESICVTLKLSFSFKEKQMVFLKCNVEPHQDHC